MAENITLRSFGLNIIPQERKEYVGKKVGKAIEGLWQPVLEYLEKNDDVFSGDILKEIEKTNIQILNLGMEMRKGVEKHSLDTNG